jgi:hypothetical protein
MLFSPIYALFDEGIANLLGLQVLRHGTSLPNYVSILTEGAKTKFGGSYQGSSAFVQDMNKNSEYIENSKNYFHVFKDSDAVPMNKKIDIKYVDGKKIEEVTNEVDHEFCCSPYLIGQVFNRALPTMHSVFSGTHMFTSENEVGPVAVVKKVAGGVLGFFTPTLRFKFTPEEMKATFEDDPDYSGLALRTNKNIGPEHLGILGSLRQGLNLQVFERIFHHPLKFLLGLIQVVAAVALSALIAVGAVFIIA